MLKSVTSEAIWTLKPVTSNLVMRRTVDLPASKPCHSASTEPPRGVTAPKPVTTTRTIVIVLDHDLCSSTMWMNAPDSLNHLDPKSCDHISNLPMRNLMRI